MKYLERPVLCSILIVVIGILAYSNTFHSEFVFDDGSSIVENAVIRNFDNFLRDSWGYNYNPRRFVSHLSFALNYRFGGLDVTGYRATNLLIHLLNALLLYALVRLTFRSPGLRNASISRDVVVKSPGKARGQGMALSDRGEVEQAIAHFREWEGEGQ